MIVNPLTGKHIKANGKLAQKLLKMHRDKEVKLKQGDVKLIKDGIQHGGTECLDDCIAKLPDHLVKYMTDNFVNTDVTFLAKLACFETQYLAKYNELLNDVGLESDVNKIGYLQKTFGEKTIDFINNSANNAVTRIIKKVTVSKNDEGDTYDSFTTYIFDGGSIPKGFNDYWVLKHINICCDPERIYWILQKIAQHNEFDGVKRSYLQLSDLSCNAINNIRLNATQTVGNCMPNLLQRGADKMDLADLYTGIGNLMLNEVIKFLQAIDIKRKVHIGL
jgi:hypothetical protein